MTLRSPACSLRPAAYQHAIAQHQPKWIGAPAKVILAGSQVPVRLRDESTVGMTYQEELAACSWWLTRLGLRRCIAIAYDVER